MAINDYEHQEQVAFFEHIEKKFLKKHPFLDKLLFAVPNGGGRTKAQGGKLKAEGVRSGVSDIVLLYPSREFHYLTIEMKFGTNKQSKEQVHFENRVDAAGGLYQVCYSCVDALKVLSWYLKQEN